MEEDRVVDEIFELGMMVAYFQKDFYGNSNFKVNANGPADLSERQYAILMTLKYTDINSLTKLAEILHSSNSNLSILMSKLAENGYIRKEYPGHKEDKRKIYFYITPAGEEKVRQITEKMEIDLFSFYMSLSEKQRRLLKEGISYFTQMHPQTERELLLPPDTIDDRDFASWLLKASLRFFTWKTHQFMQEFKVNGKDGRLLTNRQFGVLIAISQLRCNTISKLEKLLPVEGSTVSNAISKLVRNGFLIRKHPDQGDGRIVYFAITEKGDKVLQQVADNVRVCIRDYFTTLDAAQRQNLILGLDAMHELFSTLQKKIIH